MREYVIPPPRPLHLRIVDRLAEAVLLIGIVTLTAIALRVLIGG